MPQTINDIINNITSSNGNVKSAGVVTEKNQSLQDIFNNQINNNDYIHRPNSNISQKVASDLNESNEEEKFGRLIGYAFKEKVAQSLLNYEIQKLASSVAEEHGIPVEEAEEMVVEAISPNHLQNDLRPAAPISNASYYHDQDALNLAVQKALLEKQLANPSSVESGNGILV